MIDYYETKSQPIYRWCGRVMASGLQMSQRSLSLQATSGGM